MTELFDIFYKDFYNTSTSFVLLDRQDRISYPCNLIREDDGLVFEIAAINLDKKDIKITVDGDVLRVVYDKGEEVQRKNAFVDYRYKGITDKSFNLGWKVSHQYDLSKSKVSMDKGLLTIRVPMADDKKPKRLTIE